MQTLVGATDDDLLQAMTALTWLPSASTAS